MIRSTLAKSESRGALSVTEGHQEDDSIRRNGQERMRSCQGYQDYIDSELRISNISRGKSWFIGSHQEKDSFVWRTRGQG